MSTAAAPCLLPPSFSILWGTLLPSWTCAPPPRLRPSSIRLHHRPDTPHSRFPSRFPGCRKHNGPSRRSGRKGPIRSETQGHPVLPLSRGRSRFTALCQRYSRSVACVKGRTVFVIVFVTSW